MPSCYGELLYPHDSMITNTKGESVNKSSWNPIRYSSAFVVGVLLFWAFGRDLFDFKSAPIFIAGLIGVAVAVLVFAAWNIYYNSHYKGN
jgi:hypothetical protein